MKFVRKGAHEYSPIPFAIIPILPNFISWNLANGNKDKLQVGRKEVMENVNFKQTEIKLNDYPVKLKLGQI